VTLQDISLPAAVPTSALVPLPVAQAAILERTRTERVLKRTIDIIVGCTALLLLGPLIVLAALAVRLSSSGPVLFRQERVGICGRRFKVFKFRTMIKNASSDVHRTYVTARLLAGRGALGSSDLDAGQFGKLEGDVRITRVGRLLRALSIDELPQLFNVLRGDMSLVGPRPVLLYEIACYEGWQWKRLDVRPGMTGLWQVSGRSRVSINDMIRLDVEYVETWTPWLDIKLLFRTVPAVLRVTDAR
jgi:lipopolysaccharide/colanic/teichoic acid biosynthesis glycosyltransferase